MVRLFLIILAALALATATGCGKEHHRTAAPSPAAVVNACNYVTEADVQGATSNQNFRLASVGKTLDGACTFLERSAQPLAARSISVKIDRGPHAIPNFEGLATTTRGWPSGVTVEPVREIGDAAKWLSSGRLSVRVGKARIDISNGQQGTLDEATAERLARVVLANL